MAPAPRAAAREAPTPGPMTQAERQHLHALKRLQQSLLLSGASARFASGNLIRREARAALADTAWMNRAARLAAADPSDRAASILFGFVRARTPRDSAEAGGPQGAGSLAIGPPPGPGPGEAAVSNPFGDVVQSAAQAEVSIAAHGSDLIAAWNDGETLTPPGPVGFGISRDGGHTWTDGGSLPIGGGVGLWTSDPVVTVDERTGAFYVAGLVTAIGPFNGIAVVKGVFADSGLVWEVPTLARVAPDALPDKPWIAADSLTGNLYMSYTHFERAGDSSTDHIEFIRSTDDNHTWSSPMKLSSEEDDGLVQGSRPAVGPDGEVHVVWGAVDTTDAARGRDPLRVRRSFDGGASFDPQVDAATMFANFGSGAPGFNRGYGIAFPSIAVDRSDGPYRGRVYVAWQETVDYYDDVPPLNSGRVESEPNQLPDQAITFEVGETLRGLIFSGTDTDHLAFEGIRGQTVIFYLDSLAVDLDVALRLLCADGETRLAYNSPVWLGRARFLHFTLPASGRYVLRIAPNSNKGGGYRIRTGLVAPGPERARDHRDVFVAHSDGGLLWSEPSRVNQDPGWFDDWLPEVVVSPEGRPYVAWYDWRDTPESACGGWSQVYLARSDDGGGAWTELGALTTAPTKWSEVSSNLAPNQGDYIGLFAGPVGVVTAWADGRRGSPDVFAARRSLSEDPPLARPRLTFGRVGPNPTASEIVAEFSLAGAAPATLDLFDLAGRRWAHRDLVGRGPGGQTERIEVRSLPPGVYLLRLLQGGESAGARIAIVR